MRSISKNVFVLLRLLNVILLIVITKKSHVLLLHNL